MIRFVKLLRNVGTFDSDSAAATLEFKKLTIIYGNNGRGKTTLAAVLRSLATKDPLPVIERKRLGAKHPPHIVLQCDGEPSSLLFQNGDWNQALTNIKVFDDFFVDENVYSGINVDAQHGQNLHEFILGDQGVKLNRRLHELVSQISGHNTELGVRGRAIPELDRHGISVDEFCALPELQDIDQKIENAEQALKALQDKHEVHDTPAFEAIELPAFDREAIVETLARDLPTLNDATEAQVLAHFETLGQNGESWVADAVTRQERGGWGTCPFCGQDLSASALIAHYQAYFGAEYSQLKRDVANLVKKIEEAHGSGSQLAFQRSVHTANQRKQFWVNYSSTQSTVKSEG